MGFGNLTSNRQTIGGERDAGRARSHFRHFTFQSMKHLYEVILYSLAKNLPAPRLDSS